MGRVRKSVIFILEEDTFTLLRDKVLRDKIKNHIRNKNMSDVALIISYLSVV